MNDIADITDRAMRELAHTQPWPRQFRRRSLEVRSLCRLFDSAEPRRILELGCGNAFGSALLAGGREFVLATDLPRVSVREHSIGLRKAKNLLNGLGLERCEVAAASGDSLPVADGVFDLVFSLFVLEHIRDRDGCLREIHRVLAPSGLTVHAVPAASWALTAPPRFVLYLLQRAMARLIGGRGGTPSAETPETLEKEDPLNWNVFRKRYPDFPLPPPHGSYDSYLDELRSYGRQRWVELFERNGFEVVTCAPLMMLPVDLMVGVLGGAGLSLYEWAFGFDQWLAKRPGLADWGHFLAVVARPQPSSCH